MNLKKKLIQISKNVNYISLILGDVDSYKKEHEEIQDMMKNVIDN